MRYYVKTNTGEYIAPGALPNVLIIPSRTPISSEQYNDPENRRSIMMLLTSKAFVLERELERSDIEEMREAAAQFSESDADQINQIIQLISEAVEDEKDCTELLRKYNELVLAASVSD